MKTYLVVNVDIYNNPEGGDEFEVIQTDDLDEAMERAKYELRHHSLTKFTHFRTELREYDGDPEEVLDYALIPIE